MDIWKMAIWQGYSVDEIADMDERIGGVPDRIGKRRFESSECGQ
ncbi:hypothetical protein [Sphingobium cloacae]|nr:hypothetical protein [Sphingobium cloacae]